MKKTASLSGRELVKAKTHSSQDILDSTRMGSLARKGAVAGLGYLAGRKMFGTHNAGVNTAGLTLAYSIPKLLVEESQRYSARHFLKQNKGGKLSIVQREEDDKSLDATDLIGAYIGSKTVDDFMDKKSKPKKKYDISESMGD